MLSANGCLLDWFHGDVGKRTLNIRDLLIDNVRQLVAKMRRLHAYVPRIDRVAVVKPSTEAMASRPHVLSSGWRLKNGLTGRGGGRGRLRRDGKAARKRSHEKNNDS